MSISAPVHHNPYQQRLASAVKAPLVQALEERLITAVCEAGVDLNRATAYDHLSPMLAFVGGLGLRKANHLKLRIGQHIKVSEVKSRVIIEW